MLAELTSTPRRTLPCLLAENLLPHIPHVPHSRTPALPHSRTPALPHSRTPAHSSERLTGASL